MNGGVGRQGGDMRWREMMSTSSFYIMFLFMACGAISGTMIISQASPMAQGITGMTVVEAAVVVSLLAVFNTAGRLISGLLSDRVGRISALVTALLLFLAGMVLTMMTSAVGAYFQFGIGVFPGFCADRFGAGYNTLNYGIIFFGYSAAGFIGPAIAGNMFKSTGSYSPAFAAAFCAAGLGLALTAAYRMANRAAKKARSAPHSTAFRIHAPGIFGIFYNEKALCLKQILFMNRLYVLPYEAI